MKAKLIEYKNNEIVEKSEVELAVQPGHPIPEVILRGDEVFYVESYDGITATYSLVTHTKV